MTDQQLFDWHNTIVKVNDNKNHGYVEESCFTKVVLVEAF
jgi:hypothetical protein